MPMESILVKGISKHKNGVPRMMLWDIFLINTKEVGRQIPWFQIKTSGKLYPIFKELPLALVRD